MTHEELRELLNEDISVPPSSPIPDPAWDYYQIWTELNTFKVHIEELIKFIAEKEEKTDQSDSEIERSLENLQELFEDISI